jgi:hypothetical protein
MPTNLDKIAITATNIEYILIPFGTLSLDILAMIAAKMCKRFGIETNQFCEIVTKNIKELCNEQESEQDRESESN